MFYFRKWFDCFNSNDDLANFKNSAHAPPPQLHQRPLLPSPVDARRAATALPAPHAALPAPRQGPVVSGREPAGRGAHAPGVWRVPELAAHERCDADFSADAGAALWPV